MTPLIFVCPANIRQGLRQVDTGPSGWMGHGCSISVPYCLGYHSPRMVLSEFDVEIRVNEGHKAAECYHQLRLLRGQEV
jgi:hypothetical protein